MELIGKMESSQKLNTKGCCFLCLQSENIVKTEELDASQVLKTISIQRLLRHLRIQTAQSLDEKSKGHGFKQDIHVDLCETCGHMINRLSVLFQNLEKIQLEMYYFLERIHKCISQSAKAPELVQNYSKRMTSDFEALSQLAFVDNLRKQVAKESLRKSNVPRLQLVLTRTKNKKIKTEINEETCESNDGDFPGNYFPDDIPTPPSPNSTANQEEDVESGSNSTENVKPSLARKRPANANKSKYYTKDYSTGMYNCKKCDKKSKCRDTITLHYKRVHLKLRYKCDICSISVYSRLSNLKSHKEICRETMERKLEIEKAKKNFHFVCNECGKRFKTKSKLSVHRVYAHKNIRYPCDLCDKTFTTTCSLKNHKNAIHFGKRFYCKFCSKSFGYKSDFQLHKKKCVQKLSLKDEPQGTSFRDKTPPSFSNRTADCDDDVKLGISSASTSQTKEQRSPLLNTCSTMEPFSTTNPKANTGKYYTRNPSTGMYECNKCDKKSKSRNTIAEHYKRVHLKLRYKCDICNVSNFKSLSNLTKHKKTCREKVEKAAVIEQVKKKFQYVCNECGKRYQTKQSLCNHRLIVHKNVGRFPCDLCNKKFNNSDQLKSHRDAVHLGKRLNCGFCSKDFAYKRNMQMHEKKCANKLSLKEEPQDKLDVVNQDIN